MKLHECLAKENRILSSVLELVCDSGKVACAWDVIPADVASHIPCLIFLSCTHVLHFHA
jgi:hypothetical protein